MARNDQCLGPGSVSPTPEQVIADLQRQLRKAQAENRTLQRSVDNCIGSLAERTAERDRAVGELTAEAGRGHEWDEKYDAAIERGTEMYDIASNACQYVGELQVRAEAAERELEAQRALAKGRLVTSLVKILKFYLNCGSLEEAQDFEWVDWAEDAEDALFEWNKRKAPAEAQEEGD